MENTLGKRIVAGRKRKGLTQDQLAEKLGVTAQAVSKWENDQSCPDITMLPKLAEIFETTTDALLGMEEKVHEAEVVTEEVPRDENSFQYEDGKMEFHYNSGRRPAVGFAIWVLLVGVLKIINIMFFPDQPADLWHITWTSGLLVFGLSGLYRRFSFLRLGCALFGGYYLVSLNFCLLPYDNSMLLPAILVLMGLSLLADALRKPKKPHFTITHRDKQKSTFLCDENSFTCSTSFGEAHRRIDLDRLARGEASVSFGQLEVDITGCREIAPGCQLDLSCSFGELDLLVPRTCRVTPNASSSFASIDLQGAPNADAPDEITLNGNASFGCICVKYI